jgi:hypothetical protein
MFSQKIPQFSYLKTALFSVWVPISEERKRKSQEIVLESASEDCGVALLRRLYAGLGIGLELREWMRVDCITYYKFKLIIH